MRGMTDTVPRDMEPVGEMAPGGENKTKHDGSIYSYCRTWVGEIAPGDARWHHAISPTPPKSKIECLAGGPRTIFQLLY